MRNEHRSPLSVELQVRDAVAAGSQRSDGGFDAKSPRCHVDSGPGSRKRLRGTTALKVEVKASLQVTTTTWRWPQAAWADFSRIRQVAVPGRLGQPLLSVRFAEVAVEHAGEGHRAGRDVGRPHAGGLSARPRSEGTCGRRRPAPR